MICTVIVRQRYRLDFVLHRSLSLQVLDSPRVMSFFRRLSHSVTGETSRSGATTSSQGQDNRASASARPHDPSLRLVAESDVSPNTHAHYMPGEGVATPASNGNLASTAPIDIPGSSAADGLGSAGTAYQPHLTLTSGRTGPARRASEYTPSPVPIRVRPEPDGPPADNVPIPSYEMATSAPSTSATFPRRMSIGPDTAPVVGDYFGASPRTRYEVPLRTGSVGSEAVIDEEDDPLVPRARRQPPALNLRPLRRDTLATITALGDLPSSAPARSSALASAIAESDTETETEQSHSTPAEMGGSAPSVDSLAPPPISADQPHIPATIDLPAPPINSLPAYSATLQNDELRLISTVHLDPTHPSASFFSALTNSQVTSGPIAPADPQVEHDVTCETGGKKLRLKIIKGGRRTNGNGTGPIYIKMKRGGTIEGTLELGKVDHAVALEVAVSQGICMQCRALTKVRSSGTAARHTMSVGSTP